MKSIVINAWTKEYLLRLIVVACMTYPVISLAEMLISMRAASFFNVFITGCIWVYLCLYTYAVILLCASVITWFLRSETLKTVFIWLKNNNDRFSAWMKTPSEIRFKE